MTYLLTYYSPSGEFCQTVEDRDSLFGKIDFVCKNPGYRETRIYEIRPREVIQRGWVFQNGTLYILDRYMNTVEMIEKEA